jgi:hypothetical protein
MGREPADESGDERPDEDVEPAVSPLYPEIGIDVVMREEILLADITYPEIGLEDAPRRYAETDEPGTGGESSPGSAG